MFFCGKSCVGQQDTEQEKSQVQKCGKQHADGGVKPKSVHHAINQASIDVKQIYS